MIEPSAGAGTIRGGDQLENYVAKNLGPYIRGSVIEVGAGLGYATEAMDDPDANHVSHLKNPIAAGKLLPCCEGRCDVLATSLPTNIGRGCSKRPSGLCFSKVIPTSHT